MKRHRFDPLSFVFGAVFLLVAGVAVWNESFRWDINAWVLPFAALFLGIALLASTLRSNSQGSGVQNDEIRPESAPEAPNQ
jgi:hypothetical protein